MPNIVYNIFHNRIYLIFLFIVCGFSSSAQFQQPYFERVTTKQGLSQSSVTHILQDQNGFLWFATYNGLNRYDGYSFKVFTHDDKDSTSISTNSLIYIYEDSKGYIWAVNNRNAGIDRFDPITEQFEHFTHDPTNTASISDNEIYNVFEDSEGTIWICANEYLNRAIIPESAKEDKITFKKFDKKSTIYPFSWVFENKDGDLYCCADSLYKIDRKTNTLINTGVILNGTVTSAAEYDSKYIIFGTYDADIIKLEYDSLSRNYKRVDPGKINLAPNNRKVVYVDHEKHIWIGTELEGLYRYRPEVDEVEQYLPDDFEARSISDKTIYSIFKDNTGILWIGTFSQGLNKYNFYRKPFYHYYRIPYYSNSLSGDLVTAIQGQDANDLWVGIDVGGGVNRIIFNEKKKPQIIHYLPDPFNPNSIKGESTLSLVQRKNGDVWIGSAGGHISRIKPEIPFSGNSPDIKNYKLGKWTFCIYEDSDGILWGGTWGLGLWRFNDLEEKFDMFLPDSTNQYSIQGDIIWSIGEDRHKNIWIGSQGSGVAILTADEKQKDNPRFLKFKHDILDSSSISDNTVNAIYTTKDGSQWLCTTHGVNRTMNHDQFSNKFEDFPKIIFKSYFERDGLPSNGAAGLVEDDSGYLWISTSFGISKMNPSTLEFVNFNENHGLQNNEFWHNSYFKNSNGMIFFGGVNGFNAFYPDQIESNPFLPVVTLTDLKLFNEVVNVGDTINGQVVLTSPIHKLKEVILKHRNNIITLEFAALHFEQPAQNKYQYYLEGFEHDWNTVTDKRSATYTNLDPGEYTFRVKASNIDQMWSEEEVALKIKVLPPWWKSLFVKIASPFAVIFIILVIFRLRLRFLHKQKRMLESNVQERTIELLTKNQEIAVQNEELQALSEELTSQNDQLELLNNAILKQKEQISEINENLEQKVHDRTKQLNRTIDELNKTIAELDRFVYSASHDLSAPLKSIKGIINLTKYDELNEDVSQKIAYIESSINKLEDVIVSLTEFSRNNRLEVSPSDIPIYELLEDCYKDLKYLQPEYKVNFNINIDKRRKIRTDRLRLRMIANNLISNALKYQDDEKPEHFINISMQENNGGWELIFEDNGIGIHDSQRQRVFDMFHRGTVKSNGSGLGLYIVRETVAKLYGDIKFNSAENIGTTFIVSLPKMN